MSSPRCACSNIQASTSYAAQPGEQRSFGESLAAMAGIGIVNMLIALDQTTVSTALPSIVASLGGFEFYTWIASAYLLASLISVPIFGRLGDYYGRKSFVVVAIVTFTVASVLCALAPTIGALIAARALQGIGAGMMTGTAFASIPDLFPDPKARARWQVVLAAAYGIGTAAGPSLGGALTDLYGWRSTFLINLPVGIAALLCVIRYLPRSSRTIEGGIQIDYAGAVMLSLLLACVLLACADEASQASVNIKLIATASLPIVCTVFVKCEQRAAAPIIPLYLLRNRQIATLLCLSLFTGAIMFSMIFFTPLLLQAGFNLSATQAGKLSTPLAACIAVGSLLNTSMVTRIKRPAYILTTGFALLALASRGIACIDSANAAIFLELALFSGGMGLGLILNNLNIFAQEIAGRDNVGIATSLLQSTRMVGALAGVSMLGSWINRRYVSGLPAVLDALPGEGNRRWIAQLGDPQILVDTDKQLHVLRALTVAPFSGISLLDGLRTMFVSVLHCGFNFVAALAAAAFLLTWTVRSIRFE
ncbi:MFS transporter [Paraburkholderia sp. SIMBA_027]|uniref:MFS transporter n=1 Tax=Paraburkholderia sp. SIMBA_027 TaxID=3085770 RepID=UPI003977F720